MTPRGMKHEQDKLIIAHMVSSGLDLSESTMLYACPICEQQKGESIRKRRLNTAYADDAENWIICCQECFDERVDHYKELWKEAYS